MTVYKSRSYTYYLDTGEFVPDLDSDPFRQACNKFLLRTSFPSERYRLENRSYLCFKPNVVGAVAAPVLTAFELVNREETVYPLLEEWHPILIGQWVYTYFVAAGLLWLYCRHMK